MIGPKKKTYGIWLAQVGNWLMADNITSKKANGCWLISDLGKIGPLSFQEATKLYNSGGYHHYDHQYKLIKFDPMKEC